MIISPKKFKLDLKTKVIIFFCLTALILSAIGAALTGLQGFMLLNDVLGDNHLIAADTLTVHINHILDTELNGNKWQKEIPIQKIFEPLNDFKIEKTGYAVIVDSNCKIIFHPKKHASEHFCNEKEFAKQLRNKKRYGIISGYESSKKIFVSFKEIHTPFTPKNNIKWYIFIVQDVSEAFSPLNFFVVSICIIALILVFALFFVGIYIAKMMGNLSVSEQKYRILFENSPLGIGISGIKGNIYATNQRMKDITGYSDNEISNMKVVDFYSDPDELAKLSEELKHVHNVCNREVSLKRKDGSVFLSALDICRIKWEHKDAFMAVLQDITNQKRIENELKTLNLTLEETVRKRTYELERLNEASMNVMEDLSESKTSLEKYSNELEKALQVKSDFTATVSHELRTPLAAIKEGIGVVIDGIAGEPNKEQKEFLEIAKRNVDRLGRLINDVLDFQKLESGKMEFDPQNADINIIISEVAAGMSKIAKDKGLEIILKLADNIPQIKIDGDKLFQALTNLVNNAIKFTDKGTITIVSELNDNLVAVSIRDTGQGIAQDEIGRLFQKYSQLNRRKTGGTGLGLAITKQIIELQGGKIWVESKIDEGSNFQFTLPVV